MSKWNETKLSVQIFFSSDNKKTLDMMKQRCSLEYERVDDLRERSKLSGEMLALERMNTQKYLVNTSTSRDFKRICNTARKGGGEHYLNKWDGIEQ